MTSTDTSSVITDQQGAVRQIDYYDKTNFKATQHSLCLGGEEKQVEELYMIHVANLVPLLGITGIERIGQI